jgi:hypothetical protein
MKNVSWIKKIKLFNSYKRIIEQNKSELNSRFGIRIDNAKRLYTVLNIPEELIGEAYSLKTSDINRISENYVKQYSQELSDYLNKKDLAELFDFYEIKKVDKYSYLIIFGFSLFKSNKYYNILYYVVLPTTIICTILSLILLL